MYSATRKNKLEDVTALKAELHILDHLRIPVTEATETTSKGSTLDYIKRRQHLGSSLTHVSDETLDFFIKLEQNRRKCTALKNVVQHKENILQATKDECLKDQDLINTFSTLAPPSSEETKKKVFHNLVEHYLRPPQNDFRKTLSMMLGKKKKLRHRVNVLTETNEKENDTNAENLLSKCGSCGGIEDLPALMDWFLCEGTCERWYHAGCVGILTAHEIEKAKLVDPWVCPKCTEQQ